MSISRAQLAAALVEYDNDDVQPSQRKNHRQSALFSHFQPRSPPPPRLPSPINHVPLHDEDDRPAAYNRRGSSIGDHWESDGGHHDHRRSFQSRRSGEFQAEAQPVQADIDVSRWGLPDHLISSGPDNLPVIARPKMATRDSLPQITTKSASTPVPHPESSPFQHRAHSIHLDRDEPEPVRPGMDSSSRRRTISFEMDQNVDNGRRRVQSNSEYLRAADEALAAAERARALADMPRSRSAMSGYESRAGEPKMIPLPESPTSMFTRPLSSMSMNRGKSSEMQRGVSFERNDMEDGNAEEENFTPNPFALPAPPTGQASRFDPKYTESVPTPNPSSPPIRPSHDNRRDSTLSALSSRPRSQLHQTTPLAPLPLNADPDASRIVFAEIPTPGEFGKPLIPPKYARRPPADRHSLLRPRTLIMPISLQGADYVPPAKVRDGFMLGEKPLPAGARSSILSTRGDGMVWQGRGSGMLPGQAGEVQMQGKEFGRGLAMEIQETEEQAERRRFEEEEARNRRNSKMPGKLYGTSLMDQLEARKQYTKNKQRAFTGDSRPNMFARQSTYLPNSTSSQSLSAQLVPSQTSPQKPFISPPGGQAQLYPTTSRQSSSPDKTRRLSLRAPLLQFDGNDPTSEMPESSSRPGMPKSRSVFGVDELWEKEMAKLKIIQAQEEARRIEREQKDLEAKEKDKKKKGWLGRDKKGKGKGKERELINSTDQNLSPVKSTEMDLGDRIYGGVSPVKNKLGELPPTLRYSPEKAVIPIPVQSDIDTLRRRPASRADLDGWVSEDEDDVDARRRAKGKSKVQPPPRPNTESDSEDDVPLSRMIPPSQPNLNNTTPFVDSDSDEDVPVSRIAPRLPPTLPAPIIQLNSDVSGSLGLSVPALPPSISPRPPTVVPIDIILNDDDEDDDRPLGLRPGVSTKSNLFDIAGERTEAEKAEIEDDLPLGYKHAGAVQRQVSAGAGGIGQEGWGGNIPHQSFSPYQPQQPGWGMPPQMGSMGNMYGMMGYGQQGQMPMGMQGYGGMHMGVGMGMPQGVPLSGSGLPFFPAQPQSMGSPMMPPMGVAQGQQDMVGLGPPPGPGQNIDSWRKGVRAPSVVGGERMNG